ncbi:hypothetical protein I4I73_32195 [Pseudonocardia sp. KRD-184]|uniref:Uncharacterized protein n=1 Tax=Pseudonocardia oceani TaxID=2792013 RepID=A0ABS6U493_9PSEU|nr:hypothetical protein [Pseudonocardia oceani]MBW0089871.1 hypothetical protein [Pseudonocardia oceani]MBW0100647.1 hypothetical protein [Pseudonocardia oceani]MBW0123783.1 hypothetical protein [Pseudonocardia oceani]MBW0127052.1 hypothetical protein [Pseudonocardia oceani]
MTWQPEHGWPWLAGRWAVTAGAGALLAGAVWFGEPGPDRSLALDPTSVHEVELDPLERAELDGLVPDTGVATADDDKDADKDADKDDGGDDGGDGEGHDSDSDDSEDESRESEESD